MAVAETFTYNSTGVSEIDLIIEVPLRLFSGASLHNVANLTIFKIDFFKLYHFSYRLLSLFKLLIRSEFLIEFFLIIPIVFHKYSSL